MYEGSANKSPKPTSRRAQVQQEAIQPLIAAQKDLAGRSGKKKREITLKIVPDEILQEAKSLVGDRFVPALLTPGKLARESAVKAIQGEVGAKLKEKFGEEKVTDFVVNDAFYYIRRKRSAA
jgi:polyribonucleotide nucleotidyltransferase